MWGRSLAVLMWKHLMVRQRRFIHTAVELSSPVLFVFLLYIIWGHINPEPSQALQDLMSHKVIKTTEPRVLDEDHENHPLRFLLYTPNSALTAALMEEVGKKLKRGTKPLAALPDKSRIEYPNGYYPFSNVSEIADYVEKINSNEGIIIFKDMEADDWPNRKTDTLEYTIRIQKNYQTNTFKSYNKVPLDHGEFGDNYDTFMSLQWAIDTSYIKARTGKDVPQTLSVQEFPYVNNSRQGVEILCSVLSELCSMSLFLLFVFLMARLLEERTTGIQELIKMMGVSSNMLGLSHFLNVVPTGLMYSVLNTIFLKAGANPLIPNSNGLLIFIVLFLHFVSVAAIASACSYLAKSTQYTVSIAVFAYIVLWVPSKLLSIYTPPNAWVILSGLLPHVPIYWLWTEISAFEVYDGGLSFSSAARSHEAGVGPVLAGCGLLVLQSGLFFFIAWYLSQVRPGQYGQALPWNFLCQKQYWTQNEIKPESEMDEEEPIARDKKYFEEAPRDMAVGIRIENVSKFFPKQRALTNVSLDVYKGEITILLGHNGAGKTTLMSIITGMMSATEGKIYVNGVDSVKQKDQVRNQLGLCPQHNLFFPDLTVLEHAMFFALLKGGSYREGRSASMSLLSRLGIASKAQSQSGALSGGMKRRLQLACALAGGASVLVLDEPTSGLDVESRRELWDLLLSLRGDRTVLLTTHFMEEADALGDRVAALHQGQLRCHATTMYLKKAIGTGYRLSFTTNGIPRDADITSVVTSFVPEASVKEKTINSLSYNLPASESNKFPNLFTTLEEKKSDLGIETIGVGVSTLEEVFLKLCSDTDTTFNEDEVDTGRIEPTYNKITGMPLYCRQFRVLFKRQIKYVASKAMSFLILQAMMPITMIFLFTLMCNNSDGSYSSFQQPDLTLDLDLYSPMLERKVLYNVDAAGASINTLQDINPNVEFDDAKNITGVVLRTGMQSTLEYNKYLVGVELTDTEAKAFYTTVYRHAAPIAVNLLTNLIASQYLPKTNGRAITTHNLPIDATNKHIAGLYDKDPMINAKTRELCIIWAVCVAFIILATNLNFASLPCREYASGSRHIHIMSGCPAALHWLCTLTFHVLVCVLLLVVPAAIAAATLDYDSTFNQPDMILTTMLILTLGSMAFFALMYILSFYLAERSTGIVLVALMVIFGVITPAIKEITDILKDDVNIFLRIFLALCSYTMPPHSMTVAIANCAYVARLKAICTLNKDRCPYLVAPYDDLFDAKKCCAGEDPAQYFSSDTYSPGPDTMILLAQFVVYMSTVVLIEKGVLNALGDRIFNMNLKNRAGAPPTDEVVRAEAVYVDKAIALPKKQIEEAKVAMLVNDVHKNYHQIIRKSCYAVKGLSFSVKKGECFGLLGVNGAGKSTTFKMLTAEECCTKGDIYANGHFISKDKGPYLRSLGYCPQFFGLDAFQTGHDNLTLLLTLRGLDSSDVSSEVKSWIEVVGLEKYSRRVVSSYSGGCTRRLGAAAALCSGAPLVLLDEPTAGVDVAARRRVWTALRRTLALQRSVLITSHSMDEMEALCSRIAIMSGGAVRALGTPAGLRAQHAQGHAVLIKVKHAHGTHSTRATDDVDSRGKSEVDTLKSSLHTKFNCTLKDEHKTMLHYHINETMRYSDLFSELENLKSTYPSLVEDYSVTETTLEEVFLSFAKENPQGTPNETRNGII